MSPKISYGKSDFPVLLEVEGRDDTVLPRAELPENLLLGPGSRTAQRRTLCRRRSCGRTVGAYTEDGGP